MWQALREELHPRGLEVVTVALDTQGPDVVRPWVERAKAAHPSLIDEAHVTDELFGFVNVPNAVWIDEDGTIVRPAEPAFPRRPKELQIPDGIDPYIADVLRLAKQIRIEPERYVAALRAWVDTGEHALPPEEVVARSRPRGLDEASAAAHFELGQHLHRTGYPQDAVPHFRQAHRLQPDNWTYKRQAWTFADPMQGPNDSYDSDWASDVARIGPENYYPPLEL